MYPSLSEIRKSLWTWNNPLGEVLKVASFFFAQNKLRGNKIYVPISSGSLIVLLGQEHGSQIQSCLSMNRHFLSCLVTLVIELIFIGVTGQYFGF